MPRNFKNISNYFGDGLLDLHLDLQKIMEGNSDAVFGVEIQLDKFLDLILITPPYIRMGEDVSENRIIASDEEFVFYEGYLSEPHFLPLYMGLNGSLLGLLDDLDIDGKVVLQWLFKRMSSQWKYTALDMYESYLKGNDYPSPSKVVRGLQDKVLSALNRISNTEMYNTYVDEVETKLYGEGFQFQLRVAIQGDHDTIIDQIEEVIKKYDAHNAIRFFREKDKRTKKFFREAVLVHSHQIVCKEEIMSLFGGKVSAPKVEEIKVEAGDIIKLLPEYKREEVRVNEGFIGEIAEAMKRVGLINQARLYNESITAGIRLTVVQCDIPKGKTLTQIKNKEKDIQAALGVPNLSIEQGEEADTLKFSIPNENPAIIGLRELLESADYQQFANENELAFIVGVDEINNPIYLSLTKLVHLLVAGTTGSGKSVFVNTLIVALLLRYAPDRLRMYMIDPKQVELQQYNGFPHVEDVITDMDEAEQVFAQLVEEMERRYTVFKDNNVKNITLFNNKSKEPMPYIVCIVDEYADLKDTNPEVEDYIARLGQKARAAGIHLVIATQRPSTNIISGRVKANIPNTISFNLNNNTNYRTVFSTGIPYKLLGKGDGVMKIEGYPREFQRFQSAIISPDETLEEKVYNDLKEYYSNFKKEPIFELSEPEEEIEIEEPDKIKLKKLIAETGNTKVEVLRKELGIKSNRLTELMTELVEEGWLIRHKSTAKGYELIASEEELSKFK